MTPEEVKDWEKYKHESDPDAHERICQRYLIDVKRIVNRMSIFIGDGALDREDLVHAGVVGLINAIENFDLDKNIGFMDFAFKRIRGAVYDELRALDGFSARSRRQKRHLDKVKEHLQNKLLRTPTEEETAEEMGFSLEQLRTLQSSVQTVRPEPLSWENEDKYHDAQNMKQVRNWIPSADGLSQAEKFRIIAGKIENLPERTRIILGLYYREGLTLKEVAQVMSLTESRVCQIHANAIETLHQQLDELEELFLHHMT